MKTRSFFRTLSLIVISAITAIACEGIIEEPGHYNPTPPDPGPQTPSYTITVTPNGTVNIPAEGGTKEFTIKTNAPYYGYSFTKKDWMKGSIDSDKMAVVITFTANDSGAERSNEVTFYGKEKDADDYLVSEKVKVVQPALATAKAGEFSTTASLNFGDASISGQGCEVLTTTGSYAAGASSANINLVDNAEVPQLTLVYNENGDVLMFSRDLCPAGTQVSVDARSSALGLVTMYPLFAPVVGKNEFTELKKMILNASTFSALEQEAKAIIRAKKPLFAKTNTGLINALENLLNEVCIDPEDKPRRISSISGISGEGPFLINMEGRKLSIRTCCLTPMYSGFVYDSDGDLVEEMNLPAGEDYGITSYWFRENMGYNPPVTFDFSGRPDGEYTFFFSRETRDAQLDFYANVMCNLLDVIGARLSGYNPKNAKEEAVKFLMAKGLSLPGLFNGDGEVTTAEAIEFIWGLTLDWASSSFTGAVKYKALQAIANKINPAMAMYYGVKGSSNGLARLYFRISTPPTLTFCLCSREAMPITACGYVTLELVSGGGQSARAGEVLDNPIKVRVNTGNSQNAPDMFLIRFSVISGEGEVTEEHVYTDRLRAQTWWILGPEGSGQMLQVDALDPASGGVVSEEPLFVHATCTDAGDYDKDPVPTKLQGVWRMSLSDIHAEPVTITLGEQTASYYDPADPNRNFSNYPVYSEALSGGKYHIRFYDSPVADGSDQIFLENIQMLNNKIFDVSKVWNYYQQSRFVKQDDLTYPFKQVSVLCEFQDAAGHNSRVSMYAYPGPNLEVQQTDRFYTVTLKKQNGSDELETCTFNIQYMGESNYVIADVDYNYKYTYVVDSSTNPPTMSTKTEHLDISSLPQITLNNGVATWCADNISTISYFKKDSYWPEDDYYFYKMQGEPIYGAFTITITY